MKISKRWYAILGISLSIPSSYFAVAYILFELVKLGYLSRFWGISIFLLVIVNSFVLLIWHGTRKKD